MPGSLDDVDDLGNVRHLGSSRARSLGEEKVRYLAISDSVSGIAAWLR